MFYDELLVTALVLSSKCMIKFQVIFSDIHWNINIQFINIVCWSGHHILSFINTPYNPNTKINDSFEKKNWCLMLGSWWGAALNWKIFWKINKPCILILILGKSWHLFHLSFLHIDDFSKNSFVALPTTSICWQTFLSH